MLCWYAFQKWGSQSIAMKYFKRESIFMRADSVHGSMERKMKKCPEICTFQDFVVFGDKPGLRSSQLECNIMIFMNFRAIIVAEKPEKLRNFISTQYLCQNFEKVHLQCGKQGFEGDYQEVNFLKPKYR